MNEANTNEVLHSRDGEIISIRVAGERYTLAELHAIIDALTDEYARPSDVALVRAAALEQIDDLNIQLAEARAQTRCTCAACTALWEANAEPSKPSVLDVPPPLGYCSRCGAELDNVSPGYGIIAGQLVCTPCLRPGEAIALAIAKGL